MKQEVITRIWHGRTKAEHADEYLQFVTETGVADYKSVEGDDCHFWTVTK